MSTTDVFRPTSVKLPAGLRQELEAVAKKSGMSMHAYMIQTLADSVRRAHLRDAFSRDSNDAVANMKAGEQGYALDEVRAYFSQLAAHRAGRQAKPENLQPTRIK